MRGEGERGEQWQAANGHRLSFWGVGNVLKLVCNDVQLYEMLKTTELHILNG